MKTKATIVWVFLLVTFLISLVSTAIAATIATDANYTYTTIYDPINTYTSDHPQMATSGSITSTAQTGVSNPFNGLGEGWQAAATANVNGYLAASAQYEAVSAQNPDDVNATASMTRSITNSTSQNVDYQLGFNISGGVLAVEGSGDGPQKAQVNVKIMVNQAPLYQTGAILTGTISNVFTLTLTGAGDITAVPDPNNVDNYAKYTLGPLSGTLDLLVLAGQTVSLTYLMSMEASGPGWEMGALAELGDPLTLTGGMTVSDPTAVPIPGAVWLLGSGLVGLAGLRRKFKS